VYIDAFRGVMALVMVQGHLFEGLVTRDARGDALYQFQLLFHGSTAPGFLFASGFVAGLPRAPLSMRASLRRARRLLFVLGVGYALHLPYFSLAKTLTATPAEKAALWACDALQAIAVTQLCVIGLQWLVGRRWTTAAGAITLLVLVASPFVWSAGLSARLPPALGAYLDRSGSSTFPLFPFAAFVLAGTVAGAQLGRQEPDTRRRRALGWGFGLLGLGALLAFLLEGWVDFWSVSPAYVVLRLGGLILLLPLVEAAAARAVPGIRVLALLGRETLQVFVLHLYLLYGGVLGAAPLGHLLGGFGFLEAFGVLVALLPLLLGAAWVWNRLKARFPHEAQLVLVFLAVAFAFEYVIRPW
jgi:acyltransferase